MGSTAKTIVELTSQLPFSNIDQNIDKQISYLTKNANELNSVSDINLKRPPYKYNCNICHKIYTRKHGLKQHEQKHQNAEHKTTFICYLCGKVFLTTSE